MCLVATILESTVLKHSDKKSSCSHHVFLILPFGLLYLVTSSKTQEEAAYIPQELMSCCSRFYCSALDTTFILCQRGGMMLDSAGLALSSTFTPYVESLILPRVLSNLCIERAVCSRGQQWLGPPLGAYLSQAN